MVIDVWVEKMNGGETMTLGSVLNRGVRFAIAIAATVAFGNTAQPNRALADTPKPSPTPTHTRVPATATRTITPHERTPTVAPSRTPTHKPVHTPTVTPSHRSPTPARTGTPGHFKDSDSCNIVAPERNSAGGGLALLLIPALLVWARRRMV